MESDRILVVDPQVMQRTYRTLFEKHTTDLKAAFLKYHIDFVRLDVEEQVERSLMTYVRSRMELLT
jgi:hypothetical protein